MGAQLESISRVTRRGTEALVKELGVVDAIRFLNQFRSGEGDYTEERRARFEGRSVDELVREIKVLRERPTRHRQRFG